MTIEFPAEWQISGAVMLAWPHDGTDWAPMLDEIDACYLALATALAEEGNLLLIITPEPARVRSLLGDRVAQDKLLIVELPTDDTWTRDYGPLTVMRDGAPQLLDFMFNGWGLKFASANDNLASSRLEGLGVFTAPMTNCRGFVLEGGSVESDGHGTLLTTARCLLSPNRNAEMSRADIEQKLRSQLGVSHILWLEHGALEGDDTDSHIDTLARLAPHDTIIYTGCSDPSDSHYGELSAMLDDLKAMRTPDGRPYNLIELPLPDAIHDEEGNRLPVTYANYLVTRTSVFMPVYGQPRKDELACQTMRVAFPDHNICPVDCRALIHQHGSLHCATMQLDPSTLCI